MILRNLLLVAAVLCTLGAVAAGKVEVTGDTSHGTVQSSVQGAVVTLIVTPAQGYYIRKSDITASKSFMPVPEGRRMAKGIPVSDELTLVGNDPDDLSLPRTYTVTLPGEEYDVLLDVQYSERRQITEQMLSLSETLFVYNEQVQRPTVFVNGLTEGVDYDVTYAEPASVTSGTYKLTVQGRSTWIGTFERSYKIFSGGKAEVKKNIKGGIIATAIDGLTLTLTVTPEDGYYIRKENVVVEKTFMPVESVQRAAPVSNSLTINGDDPDDLSLPRTYTVELPGWEYDALVGAEFQARQQLTAGMVTLSSASFIYNGKDQQPDITVRGLTEGKDYLVIFKETSWSDVGTYSVDIVGRSTWKETVTKTFTITKAPSVVTLVPEPLPLTYTAEPQTLIAAGDAIGGTLLYSLDNSSYKTTLPEGTAAGPYTVYYMVQGDSNHKDAEPETVTVIIAKKDIVISGITAQDKVYDRTAVATLVYDGVVYDGIVEGDALTVTATGTFADANVGADKEVAISELVLGGQSFANYQLKAEGQQTLATATITPKGIEEALMAEIPSAVYTGEAITPEVSVTLDGVQPVSGTDFIVSYADNTNVGTATVTVTGKGNYQGTIIRTFLITKAGAAVTVAPEPIALTYSGSEQALVTAGEATGGTMLYSLDGEQFAAEVPALKAAGSYTVYYKVQGDANHEDTEAQAVTVTIAKKDIVISGIQAQDKVYDGTTAVTLSFDAVAFDGIVEGDVLTVTAKGVFKDANAGEGKQVFLSGLVLGGQSIANYQLAAEGQQTLATATITPAACVVTKVPVPLNLSYTGTAQVLAEAGEGTGGTMLYSLDKEGSFGTDIPSGTDAGEYILYYYVAGDQNYAETEKDSIKVNIAQIVLDSPVIELSMTTFDYDGTAKTPDVVVKDGETVIPAKEYTLSYKANVNAGEAQVIITDVEGGNYTVNGYTGFIIKKVQLTAIADNKLMELGSPMPELTVRYKGFVNDETEDVISKPSVAICEDIADAVAGIYIITVQVGEAANYDIAGENGTLTVFVPQVLADEAGNEVEASVTIQEDTCHVVITELTEEMLSGKEDIPASLKDGEGETYQVTEVASEAFEEKPSNIIIALPEGVSTTNPVTNVINGDGTCETLDLTEVDGFETAKPLEVENVVYERAVEQDEAMTVCLPYDCAVPQDVTVYILNATTDGNVSFTSLEGNTLEAYQPYLMQMNQDVPTQQPNRVRRAGEQEGSKLRLSAKNVSIAPTQEDVARSVGDYKLCGTVRGLTHAEGYNMKAYVMQLDLTWRMTASAEPEDADKQYLAPFQAYMLMDGGDGSEVIGTDIEEVVVPTIQVAIGEAGYATTYLTVPVIAPEGVTVYTGKITGTGSYRYLMLTELDGTIPAQTAVILKGNAGTYTFDVAEEVDPIEGNDLKGSFEAVDAAGKFILTKVDNRIGFYKARSGKIAAGKAYLESSADVKAFYFMEDDETSLNEELRVKNEDSANAVYDLAGRKVQEDGRHLVNSQLRKGLYIVDGKKILK